MVGLLTATKLLVLRRSMSGPRAASLIIGAISGAGLAVGTVLLGIVPPTGSTLATGLLALVLLVWTLGWVLGPMLTGGDATLRPEYFAMVPVRPRTLAAGMLGAAFVGITPIVSLVAFCLLIVYGARTDPATALVAVPAVVLQLLFVVLLSRVAMQGLGRVVRSRLGWELSAVVVGFVIAFLNTGWFAIGFFVRLFTGDWAVNTSLVVRALPSGWAAVAVGSAARGEWGLTALALGGLLVLSLLLFALWSRLLSRQLVRGTARTVDHRSVARGGILARLAPNSRLGGVMTRELRLWSRDPRRSRFLRIALWIGLFTGLLPLLDGSTAMLPWVGAVGVLFAGALSANLYGLDAGSLWLTLMTPGVERVDVRGRQLTWLALITPPAVVATVVLTAVTSNGWAWAWVWAVLPALLGGAAGLIPLVSLTAAAPFPDRPGGNPLDGFSDESGDQVRLQTLAVLLLELIVAVPGAAVVLAGTLLDSSVLIWTGVGVGVVTGVAVAWSFGALAERRLRTRGPELLDVMRKGVRRETAAVAEDGTTPAAAELPAATATLLGVVVTSAILLLLPQGLVALFLALFHTHVRSWFLALHLASQYRVPVAAFSVVLGLVLVWVAASIVRTARRRQLDPPSDAGPGAGVGSDEPAQEQVG